MLREGLGIVSVVFDAVDDLTEFFGATVGRKATEIRKYLTNLFRIQVGLRGTDLTDILFHANRYIGELLFFLR
jgi:hypothetical protein